MSINGVDSSCVNYSSFINENNELVDTLVKYGNNPDGGCVEKLNHQHVLE
jgi:hypothetical protein